MIALKALFRVQIFRLSALATVPRSSPLWKIQLNELDPRTPPKLRYLRDALAVKHQETRLAWPENCAI